MIKLDVKVREEGVEGGVGVGMIPFQRKKPEEKKGKKREHNNEHKNKASYCV